MRSHNLTKGVQRAPHRSLLKALGLSEKEMNRPIIGIANSFNELIPGWLVACPWNLIPLESAMVQR